MGMFDNPILKNLALKTLTSHFKDNNIKALVIFQDGKGEFQFQSFETRVVILGETSFNNLVKNQKTNEQNTNESADAGNADASADNAAKS